MIGNLLKHNRELLRNHKKLLGIYAPDNNPGYKFHSGYGPASGCKLLAGIFMIQFYTGSSNLYSFPILV